MLPSCSKHAPPVTISCVPPRGGWRAQVHPALGFKVLMGLGLDVHSALPVRMPFLGARNRVGGPCRVHFPSGYGAVGEALSKAACFQRMRGVRWVHCMQCLVDVGCSPGNA